MLIDACATAIMLVAMSMNRQRDERVVRNMLKVISKRLRRTHQEMARQSQQEYEEEDEEEETPEEKRS